MRLRGMIWLILSPVILILGLGMGADTGNWTVAIIGAIGCVLLAIRLFLAFQE